MSKGITRASMKVMNQSAKSTNDDRKLAAKKGRIEKSVEETESDVDATEEEVSVKIIEMDNVNTNLQLKKRQAKWESYCYQGQCYQQQRSPRLLSAVMHFWDQLTLDNPTIDTVKELHGYDVALSGPNSEKDKWWIKYTKEVMKQFFDKKARVL